LLDRWLRFRHEVTFSQNPSVGRMKLIISDEQGQLVAQSPDISTRTLAYEAGSGCGIAEGASVPDHLRLGIYHHPSYGTTSVEVAEARVMAP
jgi:hypothetical protein